MPGCTESTTNELDARILLLEEQLADLKEERNRQVSPLCSIPEEVLASILKQLQDIYIPESIHKWAQQLPVCRRIWNVALRWPHLWSAHYINSESREPFGDQRWLEICNKQGLQSELNLYAKKDLMVNQAKRFAPFTRDLHVNEVGSHATLRGLGLTATGAEPIVKWPMLQFLEINAGPSRLERKMQIRPTMLGGSSSSLTSLTLTRGYYTIGSFPALPKLRHLHVRQLGLEQDDSYLRLYELFCNSQQLVSVDLVIGLRKEMIYATAASSTLLLPLHSLRLQSHPKVVDAILDMLPDPLQRCSVIMNRYQASEQQDRVVERISIFLGKMVTNNPSQFEYQVIFASYTAYRMFLEVHLIWPSPEAQTQSLPVLRATCRHRTALSAVLRYASKVTFGRHHNFDLAFAALERSGSKVRELHFTSDWNNRWGRLPMVERYLKMRKEQGHTLELLRMDNPSCKPSSHDATINIVDLGLAARWRAEGLVENLVLPTQKFLPDVKESSKSNK
jgi:hypothetical protein